MAKVKYNENELVYELNENDEYVVRGVKNRNITMVNIPSLHNGKVVTRIGDAAFSGCTSLTSITIPNGVTSIREYAFYYCDGLTSVTIGNGVTNIGECAFIGCAELKTKQRAYKAFHITDLGFMCRDKLYQEGKYSYVRGNLELCRRGIHYCNNLFEIFGYYSGEIDKDIAIFEIKPGKKILQSDTSKCCTNSCKLVKRLYREDIIKILNGENQ